MISIHVPAMVSRESVRAISARVSDVPGVQILEVEVLRKGSTKPKYPGTEGFFTMQPNSLRPRIAR